MVICENCKHSYIKQEGSSAYTSCKKGCLFDDGVFPRSCSGFEEKTSDKCTECENDTMLKYSSLYCDYESALEQIKLLEDGLRTTRKLCDMYSERCYELENKVKLYKLKVESEDKSEY